MKKTEVINKLLDGISPAFEKKGFRLNKQHNNFIRSVNGDTQIVDFFFYKKGDSIEVEPAIRIKVKNIENLYSSISLIKDRPYCTLGNHLSDILRYMDLGVEKGARDVALSNWLINEDNDINKLEKVIPEYFEETILPYFENNTSVAKVDELLNKYPRELSIHNYLYPLRANIAIIAAKLNENPKYDELLNIYQEELEEAEETYKNEFYKLKEELKSFKVE